MVVDTRQRTEGERLFSGFASDYTTCRGLCADFVTLISGLSGSSQMPVALGDDGDPDEEPGEEAGQ